MKNLWENNDANKYKDDLGLRVYTSRLLGANPELVLHGGGNTSVKIKETNLFGEEEEILYVKGSGWDLATIEEAGFSPVKMDNLLKLATLDTLSDSDMVKYQRLALTNPSAPNPSVEAILHALIPFKYVDHTHADAVVTISNAKDGRTKLQEVYGNKVLIVPYIMPGFELAKKVSDMLNNIDINHYEAIILEHHGVFTFNDDAKKSYDKMIEIVTKAQDYMYAQNAVICDEIIEEESSGFFATIADFFTNLFKSSEEDCSIEKPKELTALELATIRHKISNLKGEATLLKLDNSLKAHTFSTTEKVSNLYLGGVQTPEHILRLKKEPAYILDEANIDEAFEKFISKYTQYFEFHTDENGDIPMHNPAPNWAVYQDVGILCFGKNIKNINIVNDIASCNITAMLKAEKLGGYNSISSSDMFDIEYWELELAKLGKSSSKEFEGKIVFLTTNNDKLKKSFENDGAATVVLEDFTKENIEEAIKIYGGVDILISDKVDNIDLIVPYLKLGINPKIIFMLENKIDEFEELNHKLSEDNIQSNAIISDDKKETDNICLAISKKDFNSLDGAVL
jgi:rhamnose utilization protein RhaD (predicted bifunctional aldolase and dehydrogenase)